MKTWIILVLIVLLLIFSGCATHREPSSITVSPSKRDFNLHLTQGNWFLKQKDFENAVVQLKKAVAIRPDSSKAHNLLGIAYLQQKDYKMAKKQYQKAIDIDPAYAQAYNNLGGVHFLLQEFDKAKNLFRKALSLSPELVSANYSLGNLLILQGQIEEGILYLSKGIELDPDFLETAYVTHFSSKAFGAPEVFFTYAKIYAQAGNIEKTVIYLRKAKTAGFKDWYRINEEKEFEKIREDKRIKDFILL